jgi:hypothetical protein
MRRRKFITVACSAVVWPLTAIGQQQLPVIGFLHVAAAGPLVGLVDAFRRGLEETGYTERQNVAIEFRWAEGDYGRPLIRQAGTRTAEILSAHQIPGISQFRTFPDGGGLVSYGPDLIYLYRRVRLNGLLSSNSSSISKPRKRWM